MKNRIILCALFVCAAALSLSSCSSSSSDDTPVAKFASASVDYYLETGGDFLNVFDVTVQYKDLSGKVVSETVSSNNYEKKLTVTTLPFTAGVRFTFKLKSTVNQTTKYNLSHGFGIVYTANMSDGTVQPLSSKGTTETHTGLQYAGLQLLVNRLNSSYSQADVLSLSNGKLVKTSATVDF